MLMNSERIEQVLHAALLCHTHTELNAEAALR